MYSSGLDEIICRDVLAIFDFTSVRLDEGGFMTDDCPVWFCETALQLLRPVLDRADDLVVHRSFSLKPKPVDPRYRTELGQDCWIVLNCFGSYTFNAFRADVLTLRLSFGTRPRVLCAPLLSALLSPPLRKLVLNCIIFEFDLEFNFSLDPEFAVDFFNKRGGF